MEDRAIRRYLILLKILQICRAASPFPRVQINTEEFERQISLEKGDTINGLFGKK